VRISPWDLDDEEVVVPLHHDGSHAGKAAQRELGGIGPVDAIAAQDLDA
jgi:hypothetical protein